MTKFIFSAIGILLFIAVVFTLVQYLIIALLKKKEEENPENPEKE